MTTGLELPKAYVFYTKREAAEYATEDDRTDERHLVLCRAADNTCPKRAINYSGKCVDHGGQYGPEAMSRLERFRRGYLSVKDLDYEELRNGVTRGNKGTVVNRSGASQSKMPEELYRQMVQELYTRHDENMRSLLDKSLQNVEAVLDAEFQTTIRDKDGNQITSGVTAAEKLNAAKFVWQTVRGKMPENVQVTVDSKPFEKVFQGIARGITREQAKRASGTPVIEGEVVEAEEVSYEQAQGSQGTEGSSAGVHGADATQVGQDGERSGDPDSRRGAADGGTHGATDERSHATGRAEGRTDASAASGTRPTAVKRTCPDVPEEPIADLSAAQRAEEARIKAARVAERRERIRASKSLKEQGVDTNVIHDLMAPPEPPPADVPEPEIKPWQLGG